jgi:hypothetical protein
MSKETTKAILVRFEEELTRRLPQFQRVKGELLPGGCRLFGCRAASDLSFYILLNVVRGERFFIDVAWTRNGRWPRRARLNIPRDLPELGVRRGEPEDGDFLFRLPLLWRKDDQSWDVIPELSLEDMARMADSGELDAHYDKLYALPDLLPIISDLVRDAVDKIEVYAVPYLVEVAKSQGRDWEGKTVT